VIQNKLLLSLLTNVNKALLENSTIDTQEEVLQLFCKTVKASACVVYLQRNHKYALYKQFSPTNSCEFISILKKNNLLVSTVSLCDSHKAGLFLRRGTCRQCLVLPLYKDHKPAGFFMTVWVETSPLDSLTEEELHLLQSIALLLSDIYCTYPLISTLKKREKSLSALYHKAEQELENYRKQVSLELHDEVGQVLTSILLQLKLLQQSEDIEYIKGRIGGLHHITLQTLEEVRRISRNLRPALLEKLGLLAALEAHTKEYTESTEIKVELRYNNLEDRLPADVENILYRAVQEGLTNVARHAKASAVMITLSKKGGNVLLQIVDDGQGMDKVDNYGLGLLGMEERVNLAKGRFWILSQQGQGVSLNILLPLDK
jgi:signal transduction histidine kinase